MVRDTDGSAFITKAEFDSLKNNFQNQIDNYNLSIDNKIDGAIAAYLAGITVSTTVTLRSLIPKQISITGSNNNKLYWSGRTDYAINTTEEYIPKMVGIWNVFAYNENPSSPRKDASIERQIVAHRRDKNRFVPIVWLNGNNVSQVVDTQATVMFSGQLAFRDGHNNWGINDSNFGMVDGWNADQVLGRPIFAEVFKGPKVSASTPHYYSTYWYSYVYLYNTTIEVAPTDTPILFNVAPLAFNDEYTKDANSNIFDFYWHQIDINDNTHLKQNNTGDLTDLTTDYYYKDTYVDWNHSGAIRGVWESKLRLWERAKPQDYIWPFLTAIDPENREIKKGIKLCDVENNGSIDISIKCNKNGYIIIYNANDPDEYWTDKTLGRTRNSETDMSWKDKSNCYEVIANTIKKINLLSVKKGDKIWILYLPGAFTGAGGTWSGEDMGIIDSCTATLTLEY